MNNELITRLRARVCEWGSGDHGHTDCWLHSEAADALEAAQREATENRIRRLIIEVAYKQIKGLEAERDAEAALADGHFEQLLRSIHPRTCGVAESWSEPCNCGLADRLAAHRERRTTPTKDGDQ